jgi:H+/gluconate symporter-like permease
MMSKDDVEHYMDVIDFYTAYFLIFIFGVIIGIVIERLA